MLVTLSATLLCCGCDPGGTPSPETTADQLYIWGQCHFFPGGAPPGVLTDAEILVCEGSMTGARVLDLDVSVNGYPLTLRESDLYYAGPVGGLAPGQGVTVTISGWPGTVSRAMTLPYPPSNLLLENNAWDISGPTVANTLSWDNPDTLGSSVMCSIYDLNAIETVFLYRIWDVQPSDTSRVVLNSAVEYYEYMSAALCCVGQVKWLGFPDNPAGSGVAFIAETWGTWSAAGGPRGGRCDGVVEGRAGCRSTGACSTAAAGEPD